MSVAHFPAGGVPDCPPQVSGSLDVRANILALEDAMRDLPQAELPLQHHYAPGLYAREMLIPAGSLVVGKIHKHSHINVISAGVAWVVTEFGKDRLVAPFTFVSEPGTKRTVLAETDVIWTTIHTNEDDCRDPDVIESRVIVPSYDSLTLELKQ